MAQLQLEVLTARELEVLKLVAIGKTNREIARILFISESTVESHLWNIFRKLAARNRTQAIHHARCVGIVK